MDAKPLSKEILSLSHILDNFNISDIDYGKFIYSILKYCYEKNIITSIWSQSTVLENDLTLEFAYSSYEKPFFFRHKTITDYQCSYRISHIVFSADIQLWSNKTYAIDLNIYSNRILKRCYLNQRFLKIRSAIFRILHAINYLNEYNTRKEYIVLNYDIEKYISNKYPRDKYMKQPVIEVIESIGEYSK